MIKKNKIKYYFHKFFSRNKTQTFTTNKIITEERAINRTERENNYLKEIYEYKINKLSKNNKIVIYTAIVNKYDSIKLPEYINNDFDYIVFTDQDIQNTGVWQIRPITYFHKDPTKTARYIKTHPHILLNDYDTAVWIDANITIINDIKELIDNFLLSNCIIGAIPHPKRKTIYQEFRACKKRRKDEISIMQTQIKKYKKDNFTHNDLIETNFLSFRLNNTKINDFLNFWWNEIFFHSKRDQLSINYAIAKFHINWHKLIQKPYSARNHPSLAYTEHDNNNGPAIKLINNLHFQNSDPYTGTPYSSAYKINTHSFRKTKTDIILYINNHHDQTIKCIDSIIKYRKSSELRLTIIDDSQNHNAFNSLKDSFNYSRWIKLLYNQEPSGYIKSLNNTISSSSSDFIIALSAPVLVTDAWAEKMSEAAFSSQDIGIVGPLTNNTHTQSILYNSLCSNDSSISLSPDVINKLCEQWSINGLFPRVDLVDGFCFGITKKAIKDIGLFHDSSNNDNQEPFIDYCFRAMTMGIGTIIATNTYIEKTTAIQKTNIGISDSHQTNPDNFFSRAMNNTKSNKIINDIRQKANNYINPNQHNL